MTDISPCRFSVRGIIVLLLTVIFCLSGCDITVAAPEPPARYGFDLSKEKYGIDNADKVKWVVDR